LSEQRNRVDLSEIIAENFGANATYVEGLLGRFRSDPSLVDDAWRAYFTELLGGDGGGAGSNGGAQGQQAAPAQNSREHGDEFDGADGDLEPAGAGQGA
jgi:2-oxoglutarate dehydrogenase complex dehydrogenase (E1) component-like enzyme